MPGKIKVKILAGRNLPVMDRSGDTTDAYVELKFGNITFKTDVCRKSLNPQWNSEWYRFEVDDSELQDEPLQIRLMDHDTYSANDAIGKVYINLNPLLLPGVPPTVKNIWTLEAAMNTNAGSQSGSVMTGWIPVYDTMHGIRGEVNIIVKVELFSDFNKFRQSSCGVQFFYSPNIPHGYHTQSIHGFVEELVVSDDPEYKWIDKIRTPRASNEARQTLFFKLSGEVQRKIGLKALDLGGNAVIGYLQNFDLEGESGIVARGIGTAVTLVKLQDTLNFSSDNIEETTESFRSRGSSFITKRSTVNQRSHEIAARELTLIDTQSSDSLKNNNSSVIEMKRLKRKDTNQSPPPVDHAVHESHSICNIREMSDHDELTNITNTANMTDNTCVSRPSPDHRQQDEASLSPSYPLPAVPPMVSKVCQLPTTKAQPTVSLHRRSSDSDLSVTPKGNSLGANDKSVTGLLKTSTAVIRTMNQDAFEMLEYPFITMQQYPPGFILHIGGLVSSRSVKLLERISNLEEPESRDAWWKEVRMEVRSHARALACNVVIGYREETSICDDVCVLNAYGTAAVINLHSSNQDPDNVFISKGQSGSGTNPTDTERDKAQQKSVPIKMEKSDTDTSVPTLAQSGKVRHTSESRDHEVLFQSKCGLCHLPYNEASVPFRVNVSKCAICKRARVPDVMFTTTELPENLLTTGRGCIIQATACKAKKDLRGELNAKEISDCLPFLEYELHSLLLNKLKVKGMNAIFGLKLQVSVGERLIIGMAVGTAVFLAALPTPSIPQIASGNSWHKEEQLAEIQKTLVETVKQNREFYRLKPVVDVENGRVTTSDTDESDDELPDLDFSVGPRDTCVLEVDDIEDMDRISLLMDDRPPDDFHVVNTQTIPGLDDLEIVRNLQMFTQISRTKIPAGQFASMPSKYFARLLQSVYFKLRRMIPCALCDMQFKLALPEPDEIQFTVIGMALGLGDPVKINKFKKKLMSHSMSKDQVKKSDDSDMIFNLDVDHTEISTDNASNSNLNSVTLIYAPSLKSRTRSPLRTKVHTTHRHKHVPLKGRYGVDITPLSYLPGGRIERYLGNLNFFFIRESTSIRENGGLSGFTHSFVMEVLAIVRAHITALGGNAMVAFFMTKCVLLHSPHKNQGQCLINVGGDVVSVSYFADEKHCGVTNC
ncbi:PREDICTED: C2 domain-containing protein 5 [Habropoda laboriosa]|uniref:C2 domain-containing protein 5 n=1 Tax=Habropoda laboriosa TaxID=597456 RepID=UPI00083D2C9B|nr:PREDICTED: C2 domain-containing protein 5 [Habropoda laboriosa]